MPPVEFLMGSPQSEPKRHDYQPQWAVRIVNPLYMGVYTVTLSQGMSVRGAEPWVAEDYVKQGSDFPAIYVARGDAVEFCCELSSRENATYRSRMDSEWK